MGSGPEGADDLCLVSFWVLGFKAGFCFSRLGFGLQGWVLGPKLGFEP